jgi:hypothetical protein
MELSWMGKHVANQRPHDLARINVAMHIIHNVSPPSTIIDIPIMQSLSRTLSIHYTLFLVQSPLQYPHLQQ